MPAAIDVTGERYGRLTALYCVGSAKGQRVWRFHCDCGAEIERALSMVRGCPKGASGRSATTSSCGCQKAEASAATGRQNLTTHGEGHGNCRTPEYRAWSNLRERCSNPRHRQYRNYGGRGIRVCDRWAFGENGVGPYECFLADMGRRPNGQHSLDRIDVDGPYAPSNCRWATHHEQQRNRRTCLSVTAGGKRWVPTELAEHLGIEAGKIYRYLKVKALLGAA